MLLEKGMQMMWGRTTDVLVGYLSNHSETIPPGQWIKLAELDKQDLKQAQFTALKYTSDVEGIGGHAFVDGPLQVTIRIASDMQREVGSMAVTFYDEHGTKLVNCDTVTLGLPVQLRPGSNEFTIRIAELHLNPGIYTVGLWLANLQYSVLDRKDSAARFEVLDSPWTAGNVRPKFDGLVSCTFELQSERMKGAW